MKNDRGSCTRFDALLLKRRSTDSRRVNASFATRGDTSLSIDMNMKKKKNDKMRRTRPRK
jgi:hypothetical protein